MTKIQLLSESKKIFFQIAKQSIFFAITSILVIASFELSFTQKVNAAEIQAISTFSQDQVFSTPRPQISGTVLDGDKVMVFIDEVLNGTADVFEGYFEYYPFLPLSSGLHSIQLRAKNSVTGEMGEYSDSTYIYIEPNPSPTLLAPDSSVKLGQDRAWVGGVAQNNSLVFVFVDNKEYVRTKTKNHISGTGSFGVNLSGLSLGEHVITTIARDSKGKDSFVSKPMVVNIFASTPAPILKIPVVNSDSGIEKPFIIGLAKNVLEVSIIVDGKVVQTLFSGVHSSGVASFSWQISNALSLGKHRIEAFASDNGKLSNNSSVIFWQVGEEGISKINDSSIIVSDKAGKQSLEDEPILKVTNPEEEVNPLTVEDNLDDKEEPIIPDVEEKPVDGLTLSDNEDIGRIDADDDNKLANADNLGSDDVDEVSPGAVIKKIDKTTNNTEFTLNTSLIIGIVILIFLLLSILVWYIQEKKDKLGQTVVDIFREDDSIAEDKNKDVLDDVKDISVTDMSDHLPGDIDVRFEEEKNEEEEESPMFFGEEEEKEEEIKWPEDFPKEQPSEDPFSPKEEDDNNSTRKPDDLPPPPPPMF